MILTDLSNAIRKLLEKISFHKHFKVAELLAEKTMLKRKQALDVAAENLRLETKIAKAEARGKVYGELIDYQEKPLMSVKERKKVLTETTDESTSIVPYALKPRYSHSTSAVSQQKIPLYFLIHDTRVTLDVYPIT